MRPSFGPQRGTSLVETVILLVVAMILMAVAIPNLRSALATIQLRAAAGNLAGLLQSARISSANTNKTCTIVTTTIGVDSAVYVDANNNGILDTGEAVQTFSSPIVLTTAPSGTQPPAWTASGNTNNTVLADSAVLGFGTRGLPCIYSSGTCSAATGYKVYYLTNNRPGAPGYALVAVSPAGRVRAYLWTGTQWQ